MTIEAVLFDYGGVFTPSPFAAAEAYAVAIGAEPAVLIEVVFGSYDTDGDHVWHRLERGEVPFADALAEIGRNAEAAGFAFEAAEMFRSLRGDHIDRERRGRRGPRGAGARCAYRDPHQQHQGVRRRLAQAAPRRRVVRHDRRFQPRRGAQARSRDLPHRLGTTGRGRPVARRLPRRLRGERDRGAARSGCTASWSVPTRAPRSRELEALLDAMDAMAPARAAGEA